MQSVDGYSFWFLGFIMNMFQAPTLPDVSDDKDEWPSLDQNEDAFEAQFQSNNLFES